jgi:hypothetical protein
MIRWQFLLKNTAMSYKILRDISAKWFLSSIIILKTVFKSDNTCWSQICFLKGNKKLRVICHCNQLRKYVGFLYLHELSNCDYKNIAFKKYCFNCRLHTILNKVLLLEKKFSCFHTVLLATMPKLHWSI